MRSPCAKDIHTWHLPGLPMTCLSVFLHPEACRKRPSTASVGPVVPVHMMAMHTPVMTHHQQESPVLQNFEAPTWASTRRYPGHHRLVRLRTGSTVSNARRQSPCPWYSSSVWSTWSTLSRNHLAFIEPDPRSVTLPCIGSFFACREHGVTWCQHVHPYSPDGMGMWASHTVLT